MRAFWLASAVLLAACAGPLAGTAGPTGAAPTGAASSATAGLPTPGATPAPAFPLTLADDEGNQLTLRAAPTRIVSLTPAATEILFAIGAGSRVVGKVEDFAVYPPEAASIPDVAAFGSVDVERIVALGADLVVAGGSDFNPPAEIAQLRSLGVPVLTVYGAKLAGALDDIELIGRAAGFPDAAHRLVSGLRTAMAQIQVATRDLARPRVYYELDASNGYWGPAPDFFGVEMIQLAGGNPLTSGTPGAFQIPVESIIAFDPEVILLGDAAYGVTSAQVAARPGWSGLSAVRSGAIRPVDDVVITRPGPRLADGLAALALAIHPGMALPGASSTASPAPVASAAAASKAP